MWDMTEAITYYKRQGAPSDQTALTALLKEAQQVIRGPYKKPKLYLYGPVWACGGALMTGIVWLLTILL